MTFFGRTFLRGFKAFLKVANRGSLFVVTHRRIFFRSNSETARISDLIEKGWPEARQGLAYVRWPALRPPSKIAILISGIGRFGNAVTQVNNAASLARFLESSSILYFRFDAIRNRSIQLSDWLKLSRIDVFGSTPGRSPDLLWKTDSIYSSGLIFDPCDSTTRKISRSLSGAMGLDATRPKCSGNILTIHLRSGDIFGPQPHPNYGQPPWAFYSRVLKAQNWTEVILVSEDKGNPNWRLIAEWCHRHDVQLTPAGRELIEALRTLVIADNLVLSRGTFAPAAILLGSQSKRLFYFGDRPESLICSATHEVWQVQDIGGRYNSSVLSKNWVNSEDQRRLMVDYPESDVSSPVLARS